MRTRITKPFSKISYSYSIKAINEEKRADPHYFSPYYEDILLQVYGLFNNLSEVKTVGDYFDIQTGQSPLKGYCDSVGKGVPFIRIQNLSPEGLSIEDVPEVLNSDSNSLLQYKDILVAITGATIGKASINLYTIPLVACNDIAILRAKDSVDEVLVFYLYAYVQSWCFQQLIKRGIFGVSNGHLSTSYIKTLPVYVPEDKNLVEKISNGIRNALFNRKRALELIDEINKMIDLKAKIPNKPSKLTFAFTYSECQKAKRLDPHYHDKYYKYVNDCIRKSTENVKELNSVVTFVKKATNPKERPDEYFKYVEIGCINNTYGIIDNHIEILGKNAKDRAKKLLLKDTILLSTTRPYRKAIAIVDQKYDNAVGTTGFAMLRPINAKDLFYLYSMLRSSIGIIQLTQRMSNSNYPAVTEKALVDILIPYYDDVYKEINVNCQNIFLLLEESIKEYSDTITRLNSILGW